MITLAGPSIIPLGGRRRGRARRWKTWRD